MSLVAHQSLLLHAARLIVPLGARSLTDLPRMSQHAMSRADLTEGQQRHEEKGLGSAAFYDVPFSFSLGRCLP